MAVPTDITDLNTTASSNSPAGAEAIGTSLDNYVRATQAILKQNVTKGSDIASSGTITIPNEGNYFVVTGTTTITGINDTWNGRAVILKFSGALTLTNSAGLILFGSNISVLAGDVITLVNESSGVYRAVNYVNSTGVLENKTIVAADNTITTEASGTIEAVELNAVIAEVATELLGKESAFASGTKMIFYQESAPTGWTQDETNNDYMLRVVSTSGGGSGGSDSPILMDVVPSHTHTTVSNGAHTHSILPKLFSGAGSENVLGTSVASGSSRSTGSNGAHTHTINTNSGASDWTPKYIDTIIASKD